MRLSVFPLAPEAFSGLLESLKSFHLLFLFLDIVDWHENAAPGIIVPYRI